MSREGYRVRTKMEEAFDALYQDAKLSGPPGYLWDFCFNSKITYDVSAQLALVLAIQTFGFTRELTDLISQLTLGTNSIGFDLMKEMLDLAILLPKDKDEANRSFLQYAQAYVKIFAPTLAERDIEGGFAALENCDFPPAKDLLLLKPEFQNNSLPSDLPNIYKEIQTSPGLYEYVERHSDFPGMSLMLAELLKNAESVVWGLKKAIELYQKAVVRGEKGALEKYCDFVVEKQGWEDIGIAGVDHLLIVGSFLTFTETLATTPQTQSMLEVKILGLTLSTDNQQNLFFNFTLRQKGEFRDACINKLLNMRLCSRVEDAVKTAGWVKSKTLARPVDPAIKTEIDSLIVKALVSQNEPEKYLKAAAGKNAGYYATLILEFISASRVDLPTQKIMLSCAKAALNKTDERSAEIDVCLNKLLRTSGSESSHLVNGAGSFSPVLAESSQEPQQSGGPAPSK